MIDKQQKAADNIRFFSSIYFRIDDLDDDDCDSLDLLPGAFQIYTYHSRFGLIGDISGAGITIGQNLNSKWVVLTFKEYHETEDCPGDIEYMDEEELDFYKTLNKLELAAIEMVDFYKEITKESYERSDSEQELYEITLDTQSIDEVPF